MSKFFRKIGRWLKKIWIAIKKIIAVILATIIFAVILTTIAVIIPGSPFTFQGVYGALSTVASDFLAWAASVTGSTNLYLASAAVKGWLATEWLAAGALAFGFGFLALPTEMNWAVRRVTNGLRYVGTQVVDAVGDVAEEVVNEAGDVVAAATNQVTKSPILLAAGVFLFFKYVGTPKPAVIESV